MNNRKPKLHPFEEPADAGELLASRYGQLLRWAMVLTRGNPGKAEEIVQEFCVYIAVAKPDFFHLSAACAPEPKNRPHKACSWASAR